MKHYIDFGLISILILGLYIGNFVLRAVFQQPYNFGVTNMFIAFGLLSLSMALTGIGVIKKPTSRREKEK